MKKLFPIHCINSILLFVVSFQVLYNNNRNIINDDYYTEIIIDLSYLKNNILIFLNKKIAFLFLIKIPANWFKP